MTLSATKSKNVENFQLSKPENESCRCTIKPVRLPKITERGMGL